MKKKVVINAILFVLFVAGLVVILYRVNYVLRHKEYAGVQDKFAEMPENSIDVVFIGSSHQFCSISPEILYDEYGMETFMLATSAQTVPMSYYAAMEAIELQKPEMIVFEVSYLANDFRTVTDKMVKLCKENDGELVLYAAPFNTLYDSEYETEMLNMRQRMFNYVGEYAKEHKLRYYNLFYEIEEIGLNGETDWMDRQHLNCYGQAKFTRYMAEQGYLAWE